MDVQIGQVHPDTVKAENEAWFYSQATVSSCTLTTSVKIQKLIIQPFNASTITASEFVKIDTEINCVEPDHTLKSDLDPNFLSRRLQKHISRLQK